MNGSTVTKLRSESTATDEALLPPFEIGIAMNLSGERQITIRCPVKEPCSREEANRMSDGLMAVAERQRSLIEIRVLEEDLASKKDALENVWGQTRREAEEKHQARLDEVTKKIADLMAKQEQIKVAGAEKATTAGRSSYKPEGKDKKDIEALQRAIDGYNDEVRRIEAEHLKHLTDQIDKPIARLEGDIRAIERLLEKHRAVVG